jgi:hypothetical protein
MSKITKYGVLVLFWGINVLSSKAQNSHAKLTHPNAKPVIGDQNDIPGTALKNVVIVYKTHFDIGYTARTYQVVHEYRKNMVDGVFEAIDANSHQPKDKQFVWTVSAWPLKQMLLQSPERQKKLEQAIRDGNIVVQAYPFAIHTETSELEDMVRGLNISSTIARKYGVPLPIAAKNTDVPGQSWLIPTLFTHAGIKLLALGGPLVNKTLGLPPIFWWEGPDGSRLLTLYFNNYSTTPMPPQNWPLKSWIYINMTGDNAGPPSPDAVNKDLNTYKSKGINAKIGAMDDFAKLIFKEDLSKLPVVRSDISDVWIHGTMSMPEACNMAQNVRPTIGGFDALNTLEKCWGIYRPDISKTINEAYENSLLFSEHTWGMANQHYVKTPYGTAWDDLWTRGLPPQYRKMEESWKDKANYINSVDRLISIPYSDAVETLADNVGTSGLTSTAFRQNANGIDSVVEIKNNRIVVYNPLPWKRDGEVVLNAFHLPLGSTLKPVDGGPSVKLQGEGPAIEDPYRIIRFVAKDIPAMGYRTYIVTNEKIEEPKLVADSASGIIESPYFKAVIDAAHGRISSLIDKRTGREMADSSAPQGFGQYFYERFSYNMLNDWLNKSLYPQYVPHRFAFAAYDMPQNSTYSSALPANMQLHVSKTAIDVTAVLTGTIPGPGKPQQISIALTLPGSMPVADLNVSWQKQPDSWPEAAWICLPFKCDNFKFRLGRLGADLDPAKDINIDNVNYHFFWINTGVAVYDSNTGGGFGLCSKDAPLVSLGEPGEYKFDTRYQAAKPYVYINLYNNHWRTNFAGWIGNGQRMNASVRLWSFGKYDTESSLYSPAMETRVPLIAARSTSKPGNLPSAQSGLILSRKGINVTAFGANPDGKGTILRLWEQAGKSGKCEVVLPVGIKFTAVQPVDLRGSAVGKPILTKNGKFSFDLRAYAPASFLIQ